MLRTVFCNYLFTQKRGKKMRTISVSARSNLNRGQKRKSYIKTDHGNNEGRFYLLYFVYSR